MAQTDKQMLRQAQLAFQRCVRKCDEWSVPISQSIVFSPKIARSSSYYAITKLDERTGVYTVSLSELIWKDYAGKNLGEALFNLAMHELCHTVEGCFNHGPKWKRLVERLNAERGCKINPRPYSATPTDLY